MICPVASHKSDSGKSTVSDLIEGSAASMRSAFFLTSTIDRWAWFSRSSRGGLGSLGLIQYANRIQGFCGVSVFGVKRERFA
jgi:hypothetical protein